MKNYICINGNKTELTEEQLEQLGIELPKANPFERARRHTPYYFISTSGSVYADNDDHTEIDECCFNIANYCTDNAIMEQRALHETLSRLLWRYSMEHDGDKIDWKCVSQAKWYVYYNINSKTWSAGISHSSLFLDTYFYTEAIARNAIEEIIKPFMAEHPEFKF